VTAVHDFTEQVAQVLPRHLGVGLEVVVEDTDADGQVAGVERILAVPALRTELASFRHDGVEVAEREQYALEFRFARTHLERVLNAHSSCSVYTGTSYKLQWKILCTTVILRNGYSQLILSK